MSRHILIVDDDQHIRELLAFALTKAGYRTTEAGDGDQALRHAAAHEPDLIVLDINMPGMNGLDVCRRLRADGDIPILFLSSRDDEIDRVVGIELGADDYVVKPFSPREVVARIGAILKRGRATAPAIAETVLRRGRLVMDEGDWSVRWQDRAVSLTATEFRLLATLVRAPGRYLSRDQIIDVLHGPGFAVTDRTIDSHVRNIRAKFAAVGGPNIIETRAGVGYRAASAEG